MSGGSQIRGYRVYKNNILTGDVLPDQLSFLITENLVAGLTYQLSVSAYNDVGEGEISN